MPKQQLDQIIDVLQKAHNMIVEHGWSKTQNGFYSNHHDGWSITEAIGYQPSSHYRNIVYQQAIRELRQTVHKEIVAAMPETQSVNYSPFLNNLYKLTYWNDYIAKDKQEVLRVLNQTITRLTTETGDQE